MSVVSSLTSMSVLTTVGLVVAMFGFELFSRLFDWMGVNDDGHRGHALKYLPVLAVLAIAFGQGLSPSDLGWRISGPLGALGRVVLGVAIAFIANAGFMTVAQRIRPDVGQETAEAAAGLAETLPGNAFVAGTAGITEEVTYRGYALERLLATTGNPVFAGVVTIVVFVVVHRGETWDWPSVVGMLVPATVITVLYLWWRSLPVLIAVHALYDFLGLLLSERMVERTGEEGTRVEGA